MADISSIKLPDGSSYNFKDATARSNYLPLAGGQMTGSIYYHGCTSSGGATGYFKFATAVINATYVNRAITFQYNARQGRSGFVLIGFQNSSTKDPTLENFYQYGKSTNGIYAVKTATSTWDFYITKEEAYANVKFYNFNKPLNDTLVSWTWSDSTVTSLPTGYQTATAYDITANTTYSAGSGLTLTGTTFAADGSAIINALGTGTTTPTDNDYYVSQYAGGGTTNTGYYRRPVSALWTYINSKASSVYLSLSDGGTVSGAITASGGITGDVTGNLTGTVTGHSTLDLPLTGGTMSGSIIVGTKSLTVTSGRVPALAKNQMGLYADGLAITNPGTANDVAWLRVTGTGESDTVLEIATGDDAGAGEKIVVRQYNTSNAVAREATLLGTDGSTTFPGSFSATGMLYAAVATATNGTASTKGKSSQLRIYGTAYGNDSTYIGTAGTITYGDPGPQIIFNTSNSTTAGQPVALIYSDHDSVGAGAGLSLVTNSSGNEAYFRADRIYAKKGFKGSLVGNVTGTADVAKKVVISSKTYSGIYASANDFANGTFYFGTALPTSYTTPWHVKYRILSTISGQTAYSGLFEVDMWGCGASRIAYKIQNNHYNTSYRSLYFHVLYSATSTGFSSGYGHAIGIGLRSSTNPTSSSYPRTFAIDLLEQDNCTFTFLDSMTLYSALSGTGSTNYSGYAEWDGYNNGLRETGDDNDYTQLLMSNMKYTAGNALYNSSLIASPDQQTYYSLVTSSGTGTGKTATTQGFKPETIKLFTGSNASSGATVTATWTTCSVTSSFDFRYSSNCAQTLTSNKYLYLKCSYNSTTDLYTLVSSGWYSQTLPTSEDGYYYIYIGQTFSTYQSTLDINHPVYYYKNGALRTVGGTATTDDSGNVISSTYLPLSGGTMTGTLTASLNGNATSATLLSNNRSATNVSRAVSTWTPRTADKWVWGQKWTTTDLTYTPSGGSATTITDSADLLIFLTHSETTNVLMANMQIDGNMYAASFVGNLSGTATTATNLASNPTVTWTAGTTAGPTLSVTAGNKTSTAVAIPTATATASGVMTTGDQTFAGTKQFNGTVACVKTNDASGTASNWPALIVGTVSSAHLEIDANEIMAKASDTTVGVLNLNLDGGAICSGSGGYHTTGPVGIGSSLSSGIISVGCKMVYDSTNKCLNFNFVG